MTTPNPLSPGTPRGALDLRPNTRRQRVEPTVLDACVVVLLQHGILPWRIAQMLEVSTMHVAKMKRRHTQALARVGSKEV